MAVLSAHLLFLYRVFVWLGNATDYIQQLHNSSRPASDRLCSVCTVIPDIALLPAWNLSYVRLLVTRVCLIKIQVPRKSCDWRLFDHVKSSYFSTVYCIGCYIESRVFTEYSSGWPVFVVGRSTSHSWYSSSCRVDFDSCYQQQCVSTTAWDFIYTSTVTLVPRVPYRHLDSTELHSTRVSCVALQLLTFSSCFSKYHLPSNIFLSYCMLDVFTGYLQGNFIQVRYSTLHHVTCVILSARWKVTWRFLFLR